MKLTYSRSVDMAYLLLADGPAEPTGVVARTEALLSRDNAMVNLDFDASGRLVGIEFSSASRQLPLSLLESAEVED